MCAGTTVSLTNEAVLDETPDLATMPETSGTETPRERSRKPIPVSETVTVLFSSPS